MNFLSTAVKAARLSGKILMRHFQKPLKIDYKEKNEIVTNADKESESRIISIIKKKFPGHSFWSEETAEIKTKSAYRWVIDPLDGTLMFAQKIPLFGISIALEKNKEPITAVCYFPALNLMYHAEKGKGSYLNNKRISASKKSEKDKLFCLMSTEILRNPKLINYFRKKLNERTLHIKDFGSCALSMCFTADGKADASFEYGIKPCDIAAGILIVREAGGKVINTKGKNASSSDKSVIALNKKIKIIPK